MHGIVLPIALALLAAVQDPSPGSPPPGTAAGPAARDLFDVARRERERELQALKTRVDALLADLQKSSDATLGYIAERIQRLATIGAPALPHLLAAMNHEVTDAGTTNAGVNAARAAAAIVAADKPAGAAALPEIARIAKEGSPFGRKNAAIVLAGIGEAGALPPLFELLEDEDQDVVREAILALGSLGALGGREAVERLIPFVSAQDPRPAAAALQALVRAGEASVAPAVLARLQAEQQSVKPAETVLRAAIELLAAFPLAEAVPALERTLRESNASAPLTCEAAVAALLATAQTYPTTRDAVLAALRVAVESGPHAVTRAAALAMNALGDDSGIPAVTKDLDQQIAKSSSNVVARYRRAEVLLEFGKWKEALRDYKDGLRIDKDPSEPDRVNLGQARAYAGMGRFADASRHLRQLQQQDLSELPGAYPEFAEMAKDARYEKQFAKHE